MQIFSSSLSFFFSDYQTLARNGKGRYNAGEISLEEIKLVWDKPLKEALEISYQRFFWGTAKGCCFNWSFALFASCFQKGIVDDLGLRVVSIPEGSEQKVALFLERETSFADIVEDVKNPSKTCQFWAVSVPEFVKEFPQGKSAVKLYDFSNLEKPTWEVMTNPSLLFLP